MFCTVAVYLPFLAVVTNLFCSWCAWWKAKLYPAHVLRSADFRLHYLMSSLKIPVCASRTINFDIIISSEIVWPTTPKSSLPFSNCSISRARGSAGLYGPIILAAFSSRSISSIAPKLENRCCSMVSADTCIVPGARWNLLSPGTLTRRAYTAT